MQRGRVSRDDSDLQLKQEEDGVFQESAEGACSVGRRGTQWVQAELGAPASSPSARRRIWIPGESGCERRQRTKW